MAKHKSTAAYRQADALNKQLKGMYETFGEESEVYQLYVNRVTAALPQGSWHKSKGGFIQVSKGQYKNKEGETGGLTANQIKSVRKGVNKPSKDGKKKKEEPLPTVKQAKEKYKKEVAEERLAAKGNTAPSESQIQREAKTVTQEEVKKYVDAKSYVKGKEDSKGKLLYNASVSDLMKTAGSKSYELLAAILQEGEKRENAEAQIEAENARSVEAGYENGKAQIVD